MGWSRRLVRSEKIYTTLQNPKVLRIVLFSLSMIFWNVFETNYEGKMSKIPKLEKWWSRYSDIEQAQAFCDCEIGEILGDFPKKRCFQKILSVAGVNR